MKGDKGNDRRGRFSPFQSVSNGSAAAAVQGDYELRLDMGAEKLLETLEAATGCGCASLAPAARRCRS